jgi:hypothetical protein
VHTILKNGKLKVLIFQQFVNGNVCYFLKGTDIFMSDCSRHTMNLIKPKKPKNADLKCLNCSPSNLGSAWGSRPAVLGGDLTFPPLRRVRTNINININLTNPHLIQQIVLPKRIMWFFLPAALSEAEGLRHWNDNSPHPTICKFVTVNLNFKF